MSVMTISEARAVLPEVVSRAAEGEEITITRHGSPVAVVVRPDVVWASSGTEVLIGLDDAHLAAALRERARRRGLTLEEELRMILESAESRPELTHSPATGLPVVRLGRVITTEDVRALEDD